MNPIPEWYAALAVAAFAVPGALVTCGPLAVVGWLRADRHRFLNGVWYGAWSVALSVAILAGCLLLHLAIVMMVLDCAVHWTLALFLLPQDRRARILHRRPAHPHPYYQQPYQPQYQPQYQQLHAQQYGGWPR